VAGCCDPRGCDQVFGPKFARHVASRYRKRGLDRASRRLVDWLLAQGIEGASVLEIGGGVGEIQLELLRHGAARTTNLELSPAYDSEAAALIAEAGMVGRVDRRLGDIATDGSVADAADFVVLHRVVCCYPDYERLLGAAAEHARRGVVVSHPPRNVVTRSMLAMGNLGLRLRGREYRSFAHDPADMLRVLRQHGFAAKHVHRGPVWQVMTATREPVPAVP
jgi:magnesium-protoporphyrin O-methyltransferase